MKEDGRMSARGDKTKKQIERERQLIEKNPLSQILSKSEMKEKLEESDINACGYFNRNNPRVTGAVLLKSVR